MAASFPTGLQPVLCDRFLSELATSEKNIVLVVRTELTWWHLYSWRHNQVERLHSLWDLFYFLESLVVRKGRGGIFLSRDPQRIEQIHTFTLSQRIGQLEHISSDWQHPVGDGA